MRRLAAALAATAVLFASSCSLGACQTIPTPIKVPVPVTCVVEVPPEPVYPFDLLQVGENIVVQVNTLLADRSVRKDYTRQVRAAATACS